MQTPSVVEHLDVLEDLPPRLLARLENPIPDQLRLQTGKERFGARIVPTVAPTTHALAYPVFHIEKDLGIGSGQVYKWRKEFEASVLRQKWSPEQISNCLRRGGAFRISHETIYQYIWSDKWAGGALYKHLRLMPKLRRTRKQFGHWEGDTVIGKDLHRCILTMVERQSGLAIIRKMDSRTAPAATQAALSAIAPCAQDFRTITLDNGTEFHDYKAWEKHFPAKCYFATPYRSWERGSNENLNGLIRQYLPKGMSLRALTQTDCDYIAFQLNTRPRKRHGYRTPLEVHREHSRSLHFEFEPKPTIVMRAAPAGTQTANISWSVPSTEVTACSESFPSVRTIRS